MVKKVLFVCKHNLFRSQVAEGFFKKMNKNKNYIATSAGVVRWDKKDLSGEGDYKIEKKTSKKFKIRLGKKSRGLSASMLKNTDILVIVADDVSPAIFRNEKSFNGKILVWKIKDVKAKDKNKELVALKSIKYIREKVRNFVKRLK